MPHLTTDHGVRLYCEAIGSGNADPAQQLTGSPPPAKRDSIGLNIFAIKNIAKMVVASGSGTNFTVRGTAAIPSAL